MSKDVITVRIVRCSGQNFWYRGQVGSTFNVVEFSSDSYILADHVDTAVKFLISKKDVEVL